MSINATQLKAFLKDYKELVVKHELYVEGCDDITFISTVKEGAGYCGESIEDFIDHIIIGFMVENSDVEEEK